MTADEFERDYAHRSGVTVEWLRAQGRRVYPCHCGEDGCQGWQSLNRELSPNPERVTIKATLMKGRDLQPGDLFSTAGPHYWDHFDERDSVGERVYIRTNVAADQFPDGAEDIYRIEIVRNAL